MLFANGLFANGLFANGLFAHGLRRCAASGTFLGLVTPLAWGAILVVGSWPVAQAAPAPRPQEALQVQPSQPGVECDRPTAADAPQCSVKAEKLGQATAWVVRDPQGLVLRQFVDTNDDDQVDRWSYFRDGQEVYRDLDANFNGKFDQCRWLNAAGTRWGQINERTRQLEAWREISPYEVAEMAVQAIQQRDAKLFSTLLPNSREIAALGFGKEMAEKVTAEVRQAVTGFSKFASDQPVVTPATRFLDLGVGRPAALPAGENGLTKDLVVYHNAAALVENKGQAEQLYLGAMIRVGQGWRLLGLPQVKSDAGNQSLFMFTSAEAVPNSSESNDAPSEEVQELIAQLEKLDQASDRGGEPIATTKQRAAILTKLASLSDSPTDREQWQRQLADMLGAAVQTQKYDAAVEQLEQLGKQLKQEGASTELQAHVEFRRLWAEYGKAQLEPSADYAKVQQAWLESLKKFADQYPTSSDAAEAMLQLGMAEEFAGREKEAVAWYTQLVKTFPNTVSGRKGAGAMRRLDSLGKPLQLAGNMVRGGQFDWSRYRGKHVLVHYWATWCEPCKADMKQLHRLQAEYAKQGFELVGVNLDGSVGAAQEYLAKTRLPWRHVFDEGGLDGRLANEMGVMTLPLMILVDKSGKVVNRNVHMAELEEELERLMP